MTAEETHRFTWICGHLSIRIKVIYGTNWHIFDHLGIAAIAPVRARLPVTETGYLSHYLPAGAVQELRGPIEATRMFLDDAAALPEWQEYLSASRQRSLF